MATTGLPTVLAVPTGGGKTLAAVLPWLYRRRLHDDPVVRSDTPSWLALVLPMRVLVEQSFDAIEGWIGQLGLEPDVGVYRVLGGEGRLSDRWLIEPERDAIFVGTVDMMISRALNRGFAASRWLWPIEFGLFNSGVQWVFDEVQLMGPALATSRQLQGLRSKLGTARATHSMWMSATIDLDTLATFDNPNISSCLEMAADGLDEPLARRMNARKRIREIAHEDIVDEIEALHQPGTQSLAVFNTVDRAKTAFKDLSRRGLFCLLLHSRFRPGDRRAKVDALLRSGFGSQGRVVVSTQVVEAGVDVSARLLFTEAAIWPSIVQRAGRCNRNGTDDDAQILWSKPEKGLPYSDDEVAKAADALRALEGQTVTPITMRQVAVSVEEPPRAILRRRDLIDLFDTTPDLSGNDIDVSPFIRDAQDVDCYVAWRPVGQSGPSPDDPPPIAPELCPVPVGELKKFISDQRRAWRVDHLSTTWVSCGSGDVRPGLVVVVDVASGGYNPETGWDLASKTVVDPVAVETCQSEPVADVAVGDDPLCRTRLTLLAQHLEDVEREARELGTALCVTEVSAECLNAAAIAGRLHDIGKAHPVFQETIRKSALAGREAEIVARTAEPFAKGGSGPFRHSRRHFRHELASALALRGGAAHLLDGVDERDLVVYLVAAHHGRVRLGYRPLPREWTPDPPDRVVALGIRDGDQLPPIAVPGDATGAIELDHDCMGFGESADGQESWTSLALRLRDRPDLGVFRLAFLEAVVRLADWRASAKPTGGS